MNRFGPLCEYTLERQTESVGSAAILGGSIDPSPTLNDVRRNAHPGSTSADAEGHMNTSEGTWALTLGGGAAMAIGALMPWRTVGPFSWPGQSGGAGYVLIAAGIIVIAAFRVPRLLGSTVVLAAGLAAFYVTARNLDAPDPIGNGVAISQIGVALVLGSAVDRLWWRRNTSARTATEPEPAPGPLPG
jgi:hypothetical protein